MNKEPTFTMKDPEVLSEEDFLTEALEAAVKGDKQTAYRSIAKGKKDIQWFKDAKEIIDIQLDMTELARLGKLGGTSRALVVYKKPKSLKELHAELKKTDLKGLEKLGRKTMEQLPPLIKLLKIEKEDILKETTPQFSRLTTAENFVRLITKVNPTELDKAQLDKIRSIDREVGKHLKKLHEKEKKKRKIGQIVILEKGPFKGEKAKIIEVDEKKYMVKVRLIDEYTFLPIPFSMRFILPLD